MRSMARILAGAARVFRTLPGILSWGPPKCGAVAAVNVIVPVIKGRTMSAAVRRRISEAQRKRWAAIKKAEAAPKPAPVRKKRRISAARPQAHHRGDEETVGGVPCEEGRASEEVSSKEGGVN